MKKTLKILLRLVISCAISFVIIFCFVFAGGWQLFASGDQILIEIGVSVIVGAVCWFLLESDCRQQQKINELQERIEKLEQK